jgi:hypothetical protein
LQPSILDERADSFGSRDWQGYRNGYGGAVTELALDAYLAFHRVDDASTDGEAQSRAPTPGAIGRFDLNERLEDALLV